jgi:hypothetical protein
MRRALASVAVLLCTVATSTACGDDDSGTDGGTTDPETIEVTFSGDTVTPSGERVEVEAGQPIDLVVTADEPGTIHVHSDPEQEFPYAAGTETFAFEISRPGVVEVESHDLEKIIVQLEVR